MGLFLREYLHKKSIDLEEATLTSNGVLLATTGNRTECKRAEWDRTEPNETGQTAT